MPNNVKKLLDMDYNTVVKFFKNENRSQFESIVTSMAKTANRRISELVKDDVGKYSPAYQILLKGGTSKFNVKEIPSLEHNDLVSLYSTVKNFLKAKSSTLKGWQKIRRNIGTRTGAKKLFATEYKSQRSQTLWRNREKRFWDLYNKIVDNYGGIVSQLNSNKIQEMLSKIQTQRNQAKTDEDISKAIMTYIDNIYRDTNLRDNEEYSKQYLDALKDESFMEEVRIAYDRFSQ